MSALSHAYEKFPRLRTVDIGSGHCYDVVDIYDGKLDKWHTAQLSLSRHYLAATSLPSQGLALFAGGDNGAALTIFFDVVDIFDGNTGKWHTAQLSVARRGLSATSLPIQGLALFAGGYGAFFFLLIS